MVNRALYEAYETALNAVDDASRAAVVEFVNRLVEIYGTELVAGDLFEYIVSNYQAIINLYGDAAMQVVNEFYLNQRTIAGIKTAYTVSMVERTKPEYVRTNVVEALKKSSGDLEQLGSYLGDNASREVRDAADRQFAENIKNDPAKPRWALIAHAGCCEWCAMHSSRGFVYYSEKKLDNIRHANCKCTVAVDFDKTAGLSGYSPDAMYKTWTSYKDGDLTRNHNSPDYYYRVTKPKLEAQKAAREQA